MTRHIAKLTVILLLLGRFTSFASADSADNPLDGIWATPSCDAPEFSMLISGDYSLEISSFTVENKKDWLANLRAPIASKRANGYVIQEYRYADNNYPIFYQRHTEAGLSVVMDDANKAQIAEENLKDEPPSGVQPQTLAACGALPPNAYLYFAEQIQFINLVRVIQDHCQLDVMQCAESVFSFFDVSADSRLSAAEISRAIRIFAVSAGAMDDDGQDNRSATGTLAATALIAPVIASALVNSLDYNNDGGVNLAEALQDRDAKTIANALSQQSITEVGTGVKELTDQVSRAISKLPH